MKTLRKTVVLSMFLLIMISLSSNATTIVSGLPTSKIETINPIEAQKLSNRLEEIKSIDLKNLSRKERKELRNEVKSIQKVQSSGGGVYLSVGAIIIIILLLILIL